MKKKKIQKKSTSEKRYSSAITRTASTESWKIYFAIAVILLISFLVYLPVLNNGLLAWDDNNYIRDNPLVHSIDLKAIFSQYVMGNYHPLTILGFAIEYKFFGIDPTGYHAVNLLLHLMNTALVFYAIFLLSEKYGVALVAALLFGVHPLHVESVAWAAELKDLLYTFFFLASWIFYMKYLKNFQKKFLFIAILLFLLSLLSKAMAASLPAVLILTDYFKERKLNARTLLEKLPFFLLAIMLGVVAVMAQKNSIAVEDIANFTLPQRIIFACFGFISYLNKIIAPLNLSAFYPYPIKGGDNIPVQYYLYVFLFLGLVVFTFYTLRFSKKIFFGIVFFAVTVFLVLQLLPVGSAMMADRYSYIPSIGVFYLTGLWFNLLWERKIKAGSVILLGAFAVFFSIKTFSQNKVWQNDLTLWNDVINQDSTVSIAYNNRGNIYLDETKYDSALQDFNKAIELNKNYYKAYSNRGLTYMNQNKFKQALDDYNKAIELNKNYHKSYYNRGTYFLNKNNVIEALNDFNKAIEILPSYSEAYVNRGIVLRDNKKPAEALIDFNKAIEIDPGFHKGYLNRGILFTNEKRNEEALSDLTKAIELKPDYYQAYHNRGNVYYNIKEYEKANIDYTKAIELKSDLVLSYYMRALAEYNSGKKDSACPDLKKAAELGYQAPADMFNLICK